MGSTRQTCVVVSCRDVTSQVELGLYRPKRMEGRVGLVGCPVADSLPKNLSPCQP